MLLYAYTSKQILHSSHDRHRRRNFKINIFFILQQLQTNPKMFDIN